MKAEDVPQEIIDLVDRAAGKLHSHTGVVVQSVAEVLTAWEQRLQYQLARIADAHFKYVDNNGGTLGSCNECGWNWPCATYVWATTDRGLTATWDPADDEMEQ